MDGRKLLRIDDEKLFQTKPDWMIHLCRVRRVRHAHPDEQYRIVVNLRDSSQCWEIVPGSMRIGTVPGADRLRIPRGAKHVVLTKNGEFVRWVRNYEDWLAGF